MATLSKRLPVRYILFRKELAEIRGPDNSATGSINASYEVRTFRPKWLQLTPKGVNRSLASILWAFLYSAIWKWQGKDYEYYLVYDGEHLIHSSVVLPRESLNKP